ncbi:hypothetical protein SAMN04490243_1282 [Robiginitalea myxolifaciens]|uniref:LSU ribosomal protein L21p n=1 Tax=Robiginitalea myxolifaciens TaxID=400055 RepID=A0A1I6G5Q8_9FLAO|nr:hypothetical protein [Robiginitalea myxolifaciens]SFR37522.1 hypothetical protein SAMN04490243_1282 [Robiginitalea myxolifaciens]
MDFANTSIWYWVILLLVGLICGIIGYFWGKGSGNAKDLSARLTSMEVDHNRLQAELEACREKLSASASLAAAVAPAIAFNAASAKAAFGKRIKEDDLKLVEGIGPKIESLFHNYDIKTWKSLSEVSVAKCQEVLDSGGDRYKIHDPSSWPMQARMAYEGKWKELKKWQDQHDHGKL